MIITHYDESYFKIKLPKYLSEAIKRNMEKYHVNLGDAVEFAFREKANNKNTLWWKAWYYNDYREIVPCIYEKEYLDFKKYPLKYDLAAKRNIFLAAVDTVCGNCLYCEEKYCENCPVRKTVDEIKEA